MPRFLYLFQVEHELPENLAGARGSDSEVRFLSYKTRSQDVRQPFYPSSSWTQGRNRLLREFGQGEWTYVIFGDADVQMELTRHGARRARGGDPWREFERFLLEHEPAVGTPAYSWHLSGRWDRTQEVQTLRFFDPVLNAFHREALPALLPYYDLLDEECADYSGRIVSSLAADLYPGHVLQTNHVQVLNPLSLRRYTERLLTKAETLYLASLRDPRARSAYRRQPEWAELRHPDMGAPRRKSGSYSYSESALAARYDLDHAIWRRKQELCDMPLTHQFYGDDRESERAQRWRERGPGSIAAPSNSAQGLRLRSHALRSRIGLVRTSVLFTPFAWLQRQRSVLRLRWHRWKRQRRRPNAHDLWRQWRASPERPLALEGSSPSAAALVAEALQHARDPELVFVDVGTGQGEALGMLREALPSRKRVIAIGVDAVQTRGFSWYSGYVLGRVDEDGMSLATILRQYGLGTSQVGWLRIAEGDALVALRSLGAARRQTLFLTVRVASADSVGDPVPFLGGPEVIAEAGEAGFHLLAQHTTDAGWVNVYRRYSDAHIWPRGFPLRRITDAASVRPLEVTTRKAVQVGIWQALADGDPDVDAIYRLADGRLCYFNDREPIVLDAGTWCPFNSQATAFASACFPLLYLPTSVSFRVTDILRGFVAQPILWAAGLRLGFHTATVHQDRNPHDLLRDFDGEIPLYLHTESMVETIVSAVRSEGSIADNLRRVYEALAQQGTVDATEPARVEAWLTDLAACS